MTYPKGGETMKRITKIEGNAALLDAVRKIRVAAYCRFSTGSDEQLLSLETQKDHYERYIKAHPLGVCWIVLRPGHHRHEERQAASTDADGCRL